MIPKRLLPDRDARGRQRSGPVHRKQQRLRLWGYWRWEEVDPSECPVAGGQGPDGGPCTDMNGRKELEERLGKLQIGV